MYIYIYLGRVLSLSLCIILLFIMCCLPLCICITIVPAKDLSDLDAFTFQPCKLYSNILGSSVLSSFSWRRQNFKKSVNGGFNMRLVLTFENMCRARIPAFPPLPALLLATALHQMAESGGDKEASRRLLLAPVPQAPCRCHRRRTAVLFRRRAAHRPLGLGRPLRRGGR